MKKLLFLIVAMVFLVPLVLADGEVLYECDFTDSVSEGACTFLKVVGITGDFTEFTANGTLLFQGQGGAFDYLITNASFLPNTDEVTTIEVDYIATRLGGATIIAFMFSNVLAPSDIGSEIITYATGGSSFDNFPRQLQALGGAAPSKNFNFMDITTGFHKIRLSYNHTTGNYSVLNETSTDVYTYINGLEGTQTGLVALSFLFNDFRGAGGNGNFDYWLRNVRIINGTEPIVIDTTPPTIDSTAINNTSPFLNDIVQISAQVTDETALSEISYANNLTGTFLNVSSIDVTLELSTNFTVNITNTLIEGHVVGNIFTANDSSGNSVQSTVIIYTVALDIISPTVTLISPSNNTRNNTIPINITFQVTDDSANLMICNLENTTISFDSGTFTQSVDSTLTLASGETTLSQSFPNLKLTCFDNSINNNSATLLLNYTLDNIVPVITVVSPTNRSIINNQLVSTLNINTNCADSPVFRLNVTITNSSDTIASFESLAPVGNVITIDEDLSISALGRGNYTITHTCSDPHTKKKIKNYIIKKDRSMNRLEWQTPDGNKFSIMYDVDNSIDLKSYKSWKSEDGSRYHFNFKVNESSGNLNTFKFIIETTQRIYYLPDSKYKAHFITGNNYIDFEFNDISATYDIYLNDKNNYVVEITTTKTNLNFRSVGELNTAILETQFEIIPIEQLKDFFDVTQCKTDIGSVLMLALFFFIAFALIILGMATNIGFIGIFGALMLWVTSWFVAVCIGIIAIMLTLLSMLFFFYFIFKGFFPSTFGGGR